MGAGWRVFKEKFHRPLAGQGRYGATTNERNVVMIKEATLFKTHIVNCQKAIRGMKGSNEAMLSTVRATMSAPLPHTYDETAHAAGSQVQAAMPIGGTTFSGEIVQAAAQEAGHSLESQVLVPIQKWLDSHTSLVTRYKEIDRLRLEVDSRKRTVHELARSVDALRAKMNTGPAGADAKAQQKLDRTVQRLQHKEAKLKVSGDSFDQQEALLFRDLCNLIKDANWLKHHVQLALRAQGECLLKAAESFGELAPMEVQHPPTAVPAAPQPAVDVPVTIMPHPSPLAGSNFSSRAPSIAGGPAESPVRSEVDKTPSTAGPPTPHRDPAELDLPSPPTTTAYKIPQEKVPQEKFAQQVPQDNPFATL